jgi:hypothetical protein
MYSVQPLHFEKVYNKSSVLSTTNSHTSAAAVFVVVVVGASCGCWFEIVDRNRTSCMVYMSPEEFYIMMRQPLHV